MPRRPHFSSTSDEYIKYLEKELDEARETIIELMPDNIKDFLDNYTRCNTEDELYRWERDSVKKVIEIASNSPSLSFPELGVRDRAYCPLCGDGDFTIPEGMRRHLEGWGNIRKCRVMKAVHSFARDYFSMMSECNIKYENQKRINLLEQRKQSEILYLVDPKKKPLLIDENIEPSEEVRDEQELELAEDRLKILGFVITVESKVKKYVNENDDYIVFADPRQREHIEFIIYKKPFPINNKIGSKRLRRVGTFEIQDYWIQDLKSIYDTRLLKAISKPTVPSASK